MNVSDTISMTSLPVGYRAAVLGATGAIGGAVAAALEADPSVGEVLRFGRSGARPLDMTDPESLAAAAETAGALDLLFIATGALSVNGRAPEKALSQLSGEAFAAAFALNAAGPALAIAAFERALPRRRRALIGALSARVGSIGDNRLGGWYAYRASKAALNQLIRSAAIEMGRKRPETVLAALHPGTVESALSKPFRPAGAAAPEIFTPARSAAQLLHVLDGLEPAQSGGFFDYGGREIPY